MLGATPRPQGGHLPQLQTACLPRGCLGVVVEHGTTDKSGATGRVPREGGPGSPQEKEGTACKSQRRKQIPAGHTDHPLDTAAVDSVSHLAAWNPHL